MATGDEHIETPTGDIDGINKTFITSVPYIAGTLRLWFNGQLIWETDYDGFIETDSSVGEFQTKIAPQSLAQGPLNPDRIKVRFIEA